MCRAFHAVENPESFCAEPKAESQKPADGGNTGITTVMLALDASIHVNM
jgi:hypothetical protein